MICNNGAIRTEWRTEKRGKLLDLLHNFIQAKLREGKLWKLVCHSVLVSRGNGLISTTGSEANVTGDEHLHLHATTTTLYFTFHIHCNSHFLWV